MILHGDCLERLKEINDGVVDMVLAGPPYGTTACKWDSVIPFEPMWAELKRVAKKNAAILVFGSQPFTSAIGASNLRMLRYSWVWEKSRPTGHLNAKRQPLTGFEDILVFSKSPTSYFPQVQSIEPIRMKNSASHLRRNKDNVTSTVSGGLREEYIQTQTAYPRGILRFKSESCRVHPTQKPVALLEYLIKTYTLEGETVLDFCMGSGSTGVAAMNLNRKFIGIEKDEGYFRIARERIEIAEKRMEAAG